MVKFNMRYNIETNYLKKLLKGVIKRIKG